MKDVTGTLGTDLLARVLKLCTCLKITRRDGTKLYFTDHDRSLSINLGDGDGAQTYRADLGYTRSAVILEGDLNVDTCDIEGLLVSGGITLADIRAGKYAGATCRLFGVDWTNGNRFDLLHGFLGPVTPEGKLYKMELQSLRAALGRGELVETISPGCRANFADSRCGVVPTAYPGTVTSVTDTETFVASGFNPAPLSDVTFFDEGKLTWTSGLNNGLSIEIVRFVNGTKTFHLGAPGMPYTIGVGNTFSVTGGCDLSFAMCKARWNNVLNFRGEPHVPEESKVKQNPNHAPQGGYAAGRK